MQRSLALFAALLAVLLAACSDDDTGSWNGTPLPGTAVTVTNLYTITDYNLPAGSSGIVVSNLNSGDRVVLIPLYAYTPDEKKEAVLRTAFRLRAEYSGGTVPETRALHNPSPPTRSLETMKRDSILLPPEDEPVLPRSLPRGTRAPVVYNVGDTADFRLPVDFDNSGAGYTTAPAVILYKSDYCYVYFTANLATHSNAGMIATNLGTDFDTAIYPRLTARFGYEWGGGPTGDGGVDEDKRITILFENVTANPPGGYFSSRNQSVTDPNSNKREMFVICHNHDYLTRRYARHATVAHEFQHLIEYNTVYKKYGTWPLSFFNEGLSQNAEGFAGYGPDSRMSYVQADPRLSYALWGMQDKDISYSYGAAFAVVEYMVRRFGEDFINTLTDAPITTIANVDTMLKANGYTNGYPGIVLDMLTAHYLNDGVYRYPAAGLYPGDSGIDTLGTTPGWNGFSTGGPVTNNNLLAGVRSRFFRTYPAELTGTLYDYGADVYEYVSGQDGRLTFGFSDTASGVRLRVIRYHLGSNVQPRIDGYADDWAGRTAVSSSDPANDNTGGTGGLDITNVSGYITNDILYLAVRVREPARLADTENLWAMKINVDGNGTYDYYMYLWDSRAYFMTVDPYVAIILDSTGSSYVRRDILEARIPLTIFPGLSGATIKLYFFTYLAASGVADQQTTVLTLTR